jgi:transcriptional regulator with PAS, ATPase and Fis domain
MRGHPGDSGTEAGILRNVALTTERPEAAAPEQAMATAIRAMRDIEARLSSAGSRRGDVLEECRRILSATSVALCHVSADGRLSYVCIAGAPDDTNSLPDALAQAPRSGRKRFAFTHRDRSRNLVLAGLGADVVYAVLPFRAEPWVEDFMAFVGDRLIRRASARSEPTGATTESRLMLPAGMIVGSSLAMRELLAQMSATVSSRLDVLLSGETGTGKELLARLVHESGPTRGGPFIAVNCAAIPGDLLEAELFGVERGVATGVEPRSGMFFDADGGTMFLDEVAELPERLQAKLLRVVQEREVLALGAKRPRRISVRIVSAHNRDLAALVAEGRFRADLYYRLRGLEFHAPPLRTRAEDIPVLATEFLNRAAEEYGNRITGITAAALELLREHPWPGNVRELQSEIRRAALLCPDGSPVDVHHFPSLRTPMVEERPQAHPRPQTLRDCMNAVERREIERAVVAARGNRSLAARMLGITRNGLASKLKRHRIEARE